MPGSAGSSRLSDTSALKRETRHGRDSTESDHGLERTLRDHVVAFAFLLRGSLRLRLSARLDPVRCPAHAARRNAATSAPSAPAISAQPMCCAPGGRDWPPRRCLAMCSRARSRCSSRSHFGRDLALVAALGAFLGHLFPVWLGFKGGKGVATYIGIVLALAWQAAIAFGLVWLVVAALTRYSSLAGLIASAATPVVFWLLREPGGSRADCAPHAAALAAPSREHRAPAQGHRGQDRRLGEGMTPRAAGSFQT